MNADKTKIAYPRSSAFIGGHLFSLASRNWQANAPHSPVKLGRSPISRRLADAAAVR
jgi:hypothetical protein